MLGEMAADAGLTAVEETKYSCTAPVSSQLPAY